MAEVVNCPECQRKLRVPDELLGRQVKCPTCGKMFTAEASAPSSGYAPVEESAPWEKLEEKPPSASGRRASAPVRGEIEDEGYDDDRGPRRRSRRGDLAPHRGQMILILGILSLFVAGPILGPIAWVMGNNDLKEMRAGRMDREGESNTNTGRICGMIATILSISILVLCCGGYAVFFGCVGLGAMGGAGGGPPVR